MWQYNEVYMSLYKLRYTDEWMFEKKKEGRVEVGDVEHYPQSPIGKGQWLKLLLKETGTHLVLLHFKLKHYICQYPSG